MEKKKTTTKNWLNDKSYDLTHWKCSTEALRSSSSLRIILCSKPCEGVTCGQDDGVKFVVRVSFYIPCLQSQRSSLHGTVRSWNELKTHSQKDKRKKKCLKNSISETKKREKGRCIYPSESSAWEADFLGGRLRVGDGRGSAGSVWDYLQDKALFQSFTKSASSFKSCKNRMLWIPQNHFLWRPTQHRSTNPRGFLSPCCSINLLPKISFTLKNLFFFFNSESQTFNLYLKLCWPI